MEPQGQRPRTAAGVTRVQLQSDPELFASLSAELLRAGKSIVFRAFGRSMRPFVRDGDALHVAPVAPETIRRGSIVLYIGRQGRAVAHRVLDRSVYAGRCCLLVRGDSSSGPCERVSAKRVLGVVTKVQRGFLVRPVRHTAERWLALARAHVLTRRAALSRKLRRARKPTQPAIPPRPDRGQSAAH
jgi:hypothetical protein